MPSTFGTMTIDQWNSLTCDICDLNVFHWKAKYPKNFDIRDGTNWYIDIFFGENDHFHSSGDKSFPDNFEDFLELLHKYGFKDVE